MIELLGNLELCLDHLRVLLGVHWSLTLYTVDGNTTPDTAGAVFEHTMKT